MPFLEHVTAGRPVPRERLLAVAEHYHHFGGVSPINGQNRRLIAAIEAVLAAQGLKIPVYFANRHTPPFLGATLGRMHSAGVRRAGVFVTSAFGSYSGCRQYREALDAAREAFGEGAPECVKLPQFYNHPGFLGPMREALCASAAPGNSSVKVLFSAHSIPVGMAEAGPYREQLLAAAQYLATAADLREWALVYQSRSGPPQQPWLEPDICDALRSAKAEGFAQVVVVPLGFISDHMEVIWDLDHEAAELAQSLDLAFDRLPSASEAPVFAEMVVALLQAPDFEEMGPERCFPAPKKHCFPGCCEWKPRRLEVRA